MSGGDDKREFGRSIADVFSQFRWTYLTFFALAAFVCSGFTASASWALLALFGALGDSAGGPSLIRLSIKALVFTAVFGGSIVCLIALKRRTPVLPNPDVPRSIVWDRRAVACLGALVVFVAVASGVRLAVYPHVEPDESHHLIVARNIALHGVYGSGMPSAGFRPFDDYDSVGPTVLVPVAAAIYALGGPLVSGRIVMAAYYVVLSVLVVLHIARSGTQLFGIAAAVFMLMAPGSLYLARTLYGEAPALAYLIAALLVWNRALRSPRPMLLCAVSGALFGCALVTKYFLVVAAWPALGMWVYDSMTHRRIRLVHAIIPAIVALAVLGAWVAVTSIYGPHGGDTAAGHLSEYRSLLLFGWASLDVTTAWLADHWIATILYLGIGIMSAAGLSMLTAYNPAWLFLTLFAVLNTYWWIFFTTGNIPRYLWFGMAIGAMFAGVLCANGFKMITVVPGKTGRWRGLALSAPILLLVAWDASPRFYGMLTRDEMRDDYAVVETLTRDYAGKNVATTFYPIERIANLLAEYPLTRVRVRDPWHSYDAVVVDTISQPDAAAKLAPTATIGRYAILEPGDTPK